MSVSVTVLLAIIAGLGALMMFPPAAPPQPTREQRERSQAHFEAIRKERTLAKKYASTGKPHPATERVTEEDLNTFLATDEEALRLLASKQIEGAFVRMVDGRIRATATREVHGVPVSVTATIHPVLRQDGGLDFSFEALDVGRLGVPAAMARSAADQMVRAVAAKLADPQLKYKSISIGKGVVSLTYDTR